MARKTKQFGVRFEPEKASRLEAIAEDFSNTPSGLVRLAVDCLIQTYDDTGELMRAQGNKSKHADTHEAAVVAGGSQ